MNVRQPLSRGLTPVPGVHINIGGGSDDGLKELTAQVGDLEGMANITFAWMVDRVRQFTKLKFNDEMLKYVVARYMDNMAAVLERQIQANAEATKSTSGIYAALKSVFVAKKPVCHISGQKSLLSMREMLQWQRRVTV